MTRAEIILRVKAKSDELLSVSNSVGGVNEGEPLSLVIDGELDESVRAILLELPLHWLEGVAVDSNIATGTPIVEDTDPVKQRGFVVLPTTFLRLVSFKLTTWYRILHTAISRENPIYYEQINDYTRGGQRNPVIAIVTNGSATRRLEYFSTVRGDHSIELFSYIPEGLLAEQLPDRLIESLAWDCASRALGITSQVNLSLLAKERYKNYIERNSL